MKNIILYTLSGLFLISLYMNIRLLLLKKYLTSEIEKHQKLILNMSERSDPSYQRHVLIKLLENGIQPYDMFVIGDPISGLGAYAEKDDKIEIYKISKDVKVLSRVEKPASIILLPERGYND